MLSFFSHMGLRAKGLWFYISTTMSDDIKKMELCREVELNKRS